MCLAVSGMSTPSSFSRRSSAALPVSPLLYPFTVVGRWVRNAADATRPTRPTLLSRPAVDRRLRRCRPAMTPPTPPTPLTLSTLSTTLPMQQLVETVTPERRYSEAGDDSSGALTRPPHTDQSRSEPLRTDQRRANRRYRVVSRTTGAE